MILNKKLKQFIAISTLTAVAATSGPAVMAKDYEKHWAAEALDRWVELDVLQGYEDGSMRPKEAVTRGELAAMVSRVFGLESIKGAKSYKDVSHDKWYVRYIREVSAAGIMNDYGNEFRPEAAATREEAAFAIANGYHISGEKALNFVDSSQISDWAKDEIAGLVAGGYIHGRLDGTFAPSVTLTRADVAVMLDKITAELINKEGTYASDVAGNLVINKEDVILENMKVTGNLYIAEGVAQGDITLKNVTVAGKIFVEGGGENSIKLVGTKANNIEVAKAEGTVRIKADAKSEMGQVKVSSAVKLEGKIKSVEIATSEAVKFENATVENIKVDVKNTNLELSANTKVTTFIANAEAKVSGNGTIKEAQINADHVKFSNIKVEALTVDKNVDTAPEVSKPTGGGGGGGSSSSGSAGGSGSTGGSENNGGSGSTGSTENNGGSGSTGGSENNGGNGSTGGTENNGGSGSAGDQEDNGGNGSTGDQENNGGSGSAGDQENNGGNGSTGDSENNGSLGDSDNNEDSGSTDGSGDKDDSADNDNSGSEGGNNEAPGTGGDINDGNGSNDSENTKPVIGVESIVLNQSAAEIFLGETLQLTAAVMPEEATNKEVKWTSSNESILSVDQNGKVTAKAEGEATITATTVDGALSDKCEIKVAAASVIGQVESQGEVVEGATVTLINEKTAVKRSVKTDAEGNYKFNNLASGSYKLEVLYAGADADYYETVEPFVLGKEATEKNISLQKAISLQFNVVDETGKAVSLTEKQIILEEGIKENIYKVTYVGDSLNFILKDVSLQGTSMTYSIDQSKYHVVKDTFEITEEGRNIISATLQKAETPIYAENITLYEAAEGSNTSGVGDTTYESLKAAGWRIESENKLSTSYGDFIFENMNGENNIDAVVTIKCTFEEEDKHALNLLSLMIGPKSEIAYEDLVRLVANGSNTVEDGTRTIQIQYDGNIDYTITITFSNF